MEIFPSCAGDSLTLNSLEKSITVEVWTTSTSFLSTLTDPPPPPLASAAHSHRRLVRLHFKISLAAQPRSKVRPSAATSSPVTEDVAVVEALGASVSASVSMKPVANVRLTFDDPAWMTPPTSRLPVETKVAACRLPDEVALVKVIFVDETVPAWRLPVPVALVKVNP